MSVAIVIPVKNEEKRLKKLLPELNRLFGNRCRILIVDEYSTDKTKEVVLANEGWLVHVKKRSGYGGSLKAGLILASYTLRCDYIIQMDADHNPTTAVKMYNHAVRHPVDFLVGFEQGSRVTRTVTNLLIRLFLGIDNYDHPTCGYRLWTRKALEELDLQRVKAKWFGIQVETLQLALHEGLIGRQVPFGEESHAGRTNNPVLIAHWLLTFSMLFLKRVRWFLKNVLVLLIACFMAPEEVRATVAEALEGYEKRLKKVLG